MLKRKALLGLGITVAAAVKLSSCAGLDAPVATDAINTTDPAEPSASVSVEPVDEMNDLVGWEQGIDKNLINDGQFHLDLETGSLSLDPAAIGKKPNLEMDAKHYSRRWVDINFRLADESGTSLGTKSCTYMYVLKKGTREILERVDTRPDQSICSDEGAFADNPDLLKNPLIQTTPKP